MILLCMIENMLSFDDKFYQPRGRLSNKCYVMAKMCSKREAMLVGGLINSS